MKKSLVVLSILGLALSLSVWAVVQDKPVQDRPVADKPAPASQPADPSPGAMVGVITDQKCAKTAKASDAECVRKCLDAGEKPVFVWSKDKSVWPINNPDSVKGLEGQWVTVTGITANDTCTSRA